MAENYNCCLCEQKIDGSKGFDPVRNFLTYHCPACGTYTMGEFSGAVEDALRKSIDLRWSLSAAARFASDENKPLTIDANNYKNIAAQYPSVSVAEKARRLLELLRSKSRFFGEWIPFNSQSDWPLIRAHGHEECEALFQHLHENSFVLSSDTLTEQGMKLTWEGWNVVEPISGGVQGLGFIAMAFSDDMKEALDYGIVPAIESDCGFNAVRVDKEHFSEKICDRIISDIGRCQFVVADFTHNRGGVYFEAGYALALERIVIWSCREDHVKDLHFDTRQYPHIVWKQPQDLRCQLRDRLRVLVPGARLS